MLSTIPAHPARFTGPLSLACFYELDNAYTPPFPIDDDISYDHHFNDHGSLIYYSASGTESPSPPLFHPNSQSVFAPQSNASQNHSFLAPPTFVLSGASPTSVFQLSYAYTHAPHDNPHNLNLVPSPSSVELEGELGANDYASDTDRSWDSGAPSLIASACGCDQCLR